MAIRLLALAALPCVASLYHLAAAYGYYGKSWEDAVRESKLLFYGIGAACLILAAAYIGIEVAHTYVYVRTP